MYDDLLYNRKKIFNCPDLSNDINVLEALCLKEVEKLLRENGKSLKDFDSMVCPKFDDMNEYENILLFNELNVDTSLMKEVHNDHLSKLNGGQKHIYDQVINAIVNDTGGLFFVYGYGGTRKTFVWKTLTFRLHSEKKIVLNVASNGIASLLLPGGRIAHSQFAIPLSLSDDSCCNIKKNSMKAELLQYASLIIWDEAPMVNKLAFEALDRILRDIMQPKSEKNLDLPFGGKVVVLGGDFCQILPVIPKASRAEIVMATVNSSYLWKHCVVLFLTENMRLKTFSDPSDVNDIEQFGKWILDIRDGKSGNDDDGEVEIQIPLELLIPQSHDPIQDIVLATYSNFDNNEASFFQDRAILAPTLDVVDAINRFVLSTFPGEEKTYLSCDSICKVDEDVNIDSTWLTVEFLNDIRCSGLPNHKLVLKKGVPIMLTRNIDFSSSLYNGTRLIVEDLGTNIIAAKTITGNDAGQKVYIPQMNLIPSDAGLPLKFQRRQFPIVVCFEMTINKSQCQSLSHVGLYLPRPVFSHGQLYVAIF